MPTRWVRRDDVLSRTQLGEVLLLAPDGDEPIALTSPGDLLWELLAEPHTIKELVDAFAVDQADSAAVAGAIDAILRRLHRQGLITATG
ncbi:MAG: PqqD family protein [Ilumatobacteraceae bacterium]